MVSIRPSNFVEGGAVPVDKNLTWKECRFNLFDYTTKAGEVVATTIAARIKYVDDDGAEYDQQYSAGDPERFTPSKDGKTLIAVVDGASLSKSSNFYILMNALINAGFPENRIPEDGNISVLDGLYTHNIGLPEPKRSGLVRTAPVEGTRERVISVPDSIIKLPWEGKGKSTGKAPVKAATKAAPAEGDTGDSTVEAIALVTEMLVDAEKVTRQLIAARAIRAKNQAVAGIVFKPAFQAALTEAGFTIDGENISMGE